jgi:hypothetical protein
MRFIGRHWLGILVLLALAFAMLGMATMPRDLVVPFYLPFALLAPVWMFRGFIRFVGRAFHHSIAPGHK